MGMGILSKLPRTLLGFPGGGCAGVGEGEGGASSQISLERVVEGRLRAPARGLTLDGDELGTRDDAPK